MRLFAFIFSALLILALPPTGAKAKDAINWLRFDYPPMYIAEGPQAGQGYMDNILNLLISHMPEYDHSIRVANLSRILAEFENGNNVCVASLFINEERHRLGHFSQGQTTVLPPVQLVFRKEDAPRFARFGNPASLREVLTDRSLVLGVSDRMSYGKDVDAAIADEHDSENVFRRAGEDVGLGLHEMLLKGRIDYTVNYSWAALFTAGPESAEKLAFLPFVEAGKQPVHHVLCTKNAWGQAVINRVDALLADPQISLRRREFIAEWIPKDAQDDYRAAFNAHFGLE